MLRSTFLILAVTGLHSLPLPSRNDALGPVQVGAAVPLELRRQGTQPSQRHLVDLRSGLLQSPVSEMERRVSHKNYVPYSVDQFRQGTQNSQAILVDLRSGLPKLPVGEMQRTMGTVYVPPSIDGFRQGTQNSRAVLVDPRTGFMKEPIGEMARSNVYAGSRAVQVCQGRVISALCYRFFSGAHTFSHAESSCRQLAPGGHLASITSSDLHSHLVSMVTEASDGPVLTWLGGVLQADKYQWIDGSPWGYSDLMPGQPQLASATKKCLEMFRVDERWWSTADCNLQRPYICSYPLTA